ncbi:MULTISPECIES: ATP-binding protein [unclassified Caballeronia]|uniref:hybrid sensor histidine kinase/response regulator n=1 Tax=unclassified Caballeronia TaxID=2646786 RepID=UPI002856AC30|nr:MULTISPECIES: ATP-binding protein [unclassified Caballeronia]MDR5777251.1 ATP-binding protein [Caballeronia sp. LZ002]MDR5798899.1 ATP-binding protein [Caballeronia sp. LZ001]MDR5852689.1 ATP-binding protein [Caballeronia sp. LZ003]
MASALIFEEIFNTAPTGSYLLSPSTDAIILAVNDAFLKVSTLRREDMVGKSLFDVFADNASDPDDTGVEALRASIARAIETGETQAMPLQRFPLWIAADDGSTRYEERFWSAVNTPIFDAAGRLLCVSHTTTDVTTAHLTRQALAASEQRFRSLFDAINQAFCVIELSFDENGEASDYSFVMANAAFEAHTGLGDVVGRRVSQLIPGHDRHFFDIYGAVATNGQPVHARREATKLGRWFDIYAFRPDVATPRQVGVLFSDITEQRTSEKRLLASERDAHAAARKALDATRRLDAVLEAVPVGIVVSDKVGAIERVNRSFVRLWGENHPRPVQIGDFKQWNGSWADHSDRHGQPLAADEWTTARILRGEDASRDIVSIESFDEPPDRHTLLSTGAPIIDDHGEIVGAVVAQLDITDRINAEEELRLADKRKDEFLAMLSHELRNPLSPIASAAELMRVAPNDAQRVSKSCEIISRQVKHMTGLIDDLLDVSRVTQGLIKLNMEVLDVNRVAADAIEQVRPLVERKKHRLSLHTSSTAVLVRADEKRLTQVFVNLLNNAAKYTPDNGTIDFTVAAERKFVKVTVADNGIGMTPEVAARAFDLFSQGERTSDRSQGGLGIGLALVRSLMQLHGGSVRAFSSGPGRGSRFVMCLEHVETSGALRDQQMQEPSTTPSLTQLRVLVVDDNLDASETLAMLMDSLGNEVRVASNGNAALAETEQWSPDICLLDIGLPDMDGYQLASLLKKRQSTSGAVLVAVTGYGLQQDKENALAAGFDYHFVKPLDVGRLFSLLGDLASHRRQD